MAGVAYLDASAVAKLIVAEAETAALERDLAQRDALISSRLVLTEVARAAQRAGSRRLLQTMDEVLEALVLVEVSKDVLHRAAALSPRELRTLDAIHLATALSLGLADLEVITYDQRLADASALAGLHVVQPGR